MFNRLISCTSRGVMKTKLLLALGALIIAAYSSGRCMQAPVEKNFEKSDAVFTATVESIKDAPEEYTMRWKETEESYEWVVPQYEVQLKVENVWKGKVDEEVLVYTNNGRVATESYPFKIKGRYVVFARFNVQENYPEETEKHLRTVWCSGNIGLDESETDVDLEDLSINILHRRHSELENETKLVEWLAELRLKQNDSDSTEIPEEAAK